MNGERGGWKSWSESLDALLAELVIRPWKIRYVSSVTAQSTRLFLNVCQARRFYRAQPLRLLHL